jgi:two-component system NtrC family response regulator
MTKQQKTILVIDDDASITSILDLILSQNGYRVITATSTAGFYQVMQKNPKIDIALVDVKLKEASGLTILKELMSINPLIKVLMMTGYSIDTLIKNIYDLGAFGILYKPFDMERVLSIITDISNKSTS